MKKFLLIIMAVFVIGGLYSWRYNSLLKEVQGNREFSDQPSRGDPAAAFLTHDQYLQLGWVEPKAQNFSFYPNHPFKKSPGVVRIGIFAGSMATCGGSTQKMDFTYPGLLQEKFKEHGFDKVEVINFGTQSYGMSQEYMLWEFLGWKYDLDYVIFTIQDNVKSRDNRFNTDNVFLFEPLHGRYIMEHGHLRFIPIAGDSRQKALKLYFRSIPLLRYLFYDKNIPFALKVFLPESLHSRANPFYYRFDKAENKEDLPIYAAFLKNVALGAKQVIFVADRQDSRELSKLIKAPNVHFFTPHYQELMDQFPYYGYDAHHPGPLGNALIADEFFSYLTGKDKWKGVLLQMEPCIGSCEGRVPGITGDLWQYDHFNFQTKNKIVAHTQNVDLRDFSEKSMDKILPNIDKTRSFLMLPGAGGKYIIFLPLLFDLQDGQKVYLSVRHGWEDASLLIGTVHATNKIIGEMGIIKGRFTANYNGALHEIKTSLILYDRNILKEFHGVKEGDIVINNSKVARVSMSNGKLRVQNENMVFLSSNFNYFYDGDPFDLSGGTVDFVVTKKDGEQQRCPILSYQWVPFEKPILRHKSEAVVTIKS